MKIGARDRKCGFWIFGPRRHEISRVARAGVSSLLTMTCKRQECRKSTVTFVLRMPLLPQLIIIQILAD